LINLTDAAPKAKQGKQELGSGSQGERERKKEKQLGGGATKKYKWITGGIGDFNNKETLEKTKLNEPGPWKEGRNKIGGAKKGGKLVRRLREKNGELGLELTV